jgi:signal transduction histidine kinase
LKILVVEDDESSRVLLCALLEAHDHNVMSASNGKIALEMVRQSIPDIIITDILMPEMDGYSLCREVKNDSNLQHIPLIFYTATYINEEDRKLGLLLGATKYILKPQEPKVLIELINEVIAEYAENKFSSPQLLKDSQFVLDRLHLEAVSRKLQQKAKDFEFVKEEKDKLSEKLVQLASEFHNINEALSDFTYSASHDLLEPLRKISSFSSRLSEVYGDNLDERQQAYLSVIEKSSRRMKKYIDDLSTFAEITRVELVFEEINLEEVFSITQDKFASKIRASKAEFTLETLHTLVSDRHLIIELFGNIVSNSLKFIKANTPPTIHISSQKTEEDYIEVIIKDSGIGFDEKHTDRIFKSFQRLHGHHQYEGSGMGLAICKKILARLEGSITAKSSPGNGATFFIRLPLKPKK